MGVYRTSQEFEELKQTIGRSLPNRRMTELVRFGAVEINGMMVVFKNRLDTYESVSFEHYGERHDMEHHYKELQGKAIIFDIDLLNRAGREALMNYYYGL